MTLYPEGYPERTFVSNGVLVTCSSYKEVSVIIREQLLVVVLLEQNWRSNFRARWVRNHVTLNQCRTDRTRRKLTLREINTTPIKPFQSEGVAVDSCFVIFVAHQNGVTNMQKCSSGKISAQLKKALTLDSVTPTESRYIMSGRAYVLRHNRLRSFSCSITTSAYIEENPQNIILKILAKKVMSRHV